MVEPPVTITRHADVTAVLNAPQCVVPPPPALETDGSGIGWLRSRVSRFSNGETHVRRRDLVRAMLAGVDPGALRRRATDLASEPLELVPAAVLAEALGIRTPVATLVAAVARGYFPGSDGGAVADSAVDTLVTVLSGQHDDATAATIGVLVQAHDATAGLVANTLAAYERIVTSPDIDAMLVETLRHDPPVRVMRRVCTAPYRGHSTDTLLALDIAAANRDPEVFADPDRFDPYRREAHQHLTLGAGLRPCPGRDHAMAIAAGIVAAVRT
jgi:cytochrome P450